MKDLRVTEQEIMEFERYLRNEERERATIEKYLRDVRFFCTWLGRRPLTREAVIEWKELLQEKGYASVTVNATRIPVAQIVSIRSASRSFPCLRAAASSVS